MTNGPRPEKGGAEVVTGNPEPVPATTTPALPSTKPPRDGDQPATLLDLVRRFPAAFTAARYQPHRPLKVGIHRDLADILTRKEGHRILGTYTHRPTYLRAVTVGAARVDLNGEPVGVVTPAEAEMARAHLDRIEAKLAEQFRVAREQRQAALRPVVKPKPPQSEPAPAPPGPRRLGLAGPKAAAIARRTGGAS